nr:hypothetical protein HmN_000173600 [Hymenolepis microstoma]
MLARTYWDDRRATYLVPIRCSRTADHLTNTNLAPFVITSAFSLLFQTPTPSPTTTVQFTDDLTDFRKDYCTLPALKKISVFR